MGLRLKALLVVGFGAATTVTSFAVQAGGFPLTGNNATDPYLIMRSAGNACNQGDSVTCTGGNGLTSNKYYAFFVEVPAGTGELRIEMFDADVGLGGSEASAGRDQNSGRYDYTLRNPSGTLQTTRFASGRSTATGLFDAGGSAVNCQTTGPTSGDNAWCLYYQVNSPANGHWEIRMTPNGTAGQISAVGLRARDTVTGRDLNVYARSYIHYGNQTVNARRDYTIANNNNAFYPYVTAGCSLRSYDFDSDNDNDQFHIFDYLGPAAPLSVTHTESTTNLSANDAWNSTTILHASDIAANRYGIWRQQVDSGNASNHVEIWHSPSYINVIPAVTNPNADSFRIYFPRNDGSAPVKPIFRHSITTVVSGATTPVTGSPTRFRIGLAIRNPTPYPITFNASNLVAVTVPASDANATRSYQGNFTTNCGAVVSQPSIGGSGTLTWNPGSIAAGGSCDASYEISVTPINSGRHRLTASTATGTTANILDETGAAFQLGPLCELAIETGTDYSSVPVSIGYVRAQPRGGSVTLEFETLSETGSLYFRVLDADQPEVELAERIGATASADHEPSLYRVQMRAPSAGRFLIEQVEYGGKVQRFGPYASNAEHGRRLTLNPVDWLAVNAEQSRFEAAAGARTGANTAELKVDRSGLYRVDYETLLAAGANLGGIPAHQLALVSDGQPIARAVHSSGSFGAGDYIEFYAYAPAQPYYGRTRSYWLTHQPELAVDWPQSLQRPDAATASALQQRSVRLDDNRAYAVGSPLSDPWFLRRLSRSSAALSSISETLQLSGVATDQPARLRLSAWGGLDYPDSQPDHAISVAINGLALGEYRFDGVNPLLRSIDIPAGVLTEGGNEITISLLPTAYPSDRVHIEALQIDYLGDSAASDGEWQLRIAPEEGQNPGPPSAISAAGFESVEASNCLADCASYRISGFSAAPRLFQVDGDNVVELLGARLHDNDWLVAVPGPGEYVAVDSVRTPRVSVPSATLPRLQAVDLLIISHPSFVEALAPLVAQRRSEGLITEVVTTDAIHAHRKSAYPSAPAIADYLHSLATSGAQPRYLLLVGGDSYDYDDVLGLGSRSFLPTHYRRTGALVGHAPTDLPYADWNRDGQPDIAVGRWPVRSAVEVQTLVDKTLQFAASDAQSGALLISDRNADAYSFAEQNQIMAAATSYAGPRASLDLDQFAAGSAGTALARDQLVGALVEGRRWLNYFGHASPSRWTGDGLLGASDVANGLLDDAAQPFLAAQWGCWGAYFVLPEYNSLAHALLAADGGAAALIGASTLTETGPSTALGAAMLAQLDQSTRLGDAWRNGLREQIQRDPQAIDVNLGTVLLGDPSMPLR